MLDELRQLYQEVILDHGRSPRNFRRIAQATCNAHGQNPMCGDQLDVFLIVGADGRITDVSFEGKGCAISMASASLMTETLKGRPVGEALKLFEAFQTMCTTEGFDPSAAGVDPDAMERLEVLAGVREFPVRVKCATLAWHTLKAALTHQNHASTE
jgi:nitrogen fixation NifU-like protein